MDLHTLLSKMEEQFEKQTARITENVTKNLSATIDEKLKPLLKENQELKKEVTFLKTKLQDLERETRKNNIILHEVKETEKNTTDLIEMVLETLNAVCEKAGIENWDKWEIASFVGWENLSRTKQDLSLYLLPSLGAKWKC